MRHRVDGKKLNRTTSHRRAMWRNMASSLIQHGAIRTTEAKAKQLRRLVEKLITTAKEGTLHARRRVIADLMDVEMFNDDGESLEQTVVQKLFDEIAPRYADRPGGYTRIIHLAERRIGDAGKQVILQLVEETSGEGDEKSAGSSKRKARAAKRHDAAAAVAVKAAPAAEEEAPAEDDVAPEVAEEAVEAPAEEAADSGEPEETKED
jgi:large subunit ribosomal protein L17